MYWVNKQTLQGFQKIYKDIYWKDITEDEALLCATSLLSFIRYALYPKSFDYGD